MKILTKEQELLILDIAEKLSQYLITIRQEKSPALNELNAIKNEKKHKNLAPERLLTRREAGEYLGVKESTLAIWACNKRYKLPYKKIGRLVKYQVSDLDKFIMDNNRER